MGNEERERERERERGLSFGMVSDGLAVAVEVVVAWWWWWWWWWCFGPPEGPQKVALLLLHKLRRPVLHRANVVKDLLVVILEPFHPVCRVVLGDVGGCRRVPGGVTWRCWRVLSGAEWCRTGRRDPDSYLSSVSIHDI